MRRVIGLTAISIVVVLASSGLRAEVKTQEKSLVKFEGVIGRMVGLFGGKAAREGVVSPVAVKGDRKATTTEQSGQIIDLAEEKVYDIDFRKKTYTVTTFAEYRRQIEEARQKAAEQAAREQPREPGEEPPAREFEVDFDVKATDQTRTVNGFECRQVIATVTVRQKGRTIEEAGGIVMTSDMWLAPAIPAMKEVAEFDRRFVSKLGIDVASAAEQMAAALAMYPGLAQARDRFAKEQVRLGGTPVLTTTRFESVKGAAAAKAAPQEEQRPSAGVGGLLGGLGRRIAKPKQSDTDRATTGGRTTIMTGTHEVLSVAAEVNPADVTLPAGFRQR
jgi:hypothetical protein